MRIENRQLVHILVFFLIVQFGGLLLASIVFANTPISSSINGSGTAITPLQIVAYFAEIIVVAIIILFIIKFYHGSILFTLLEAFAIIPTSFIFFFIVLAFLFPQASFNFVVVTSALLAVILVVAKNKKPSLRNITAMVASIGLGVAGGVGFGFLVAFLLMFIFAIYDYIAVFVTKHMVTMAQALSSRNLAFLVSASDVEVTSEKQLSKSERKEYKKYKKEMKSVNNPMIKKIFESGEVPMVAQIQLGTGDLGLPLILAVSAYTVFFNYFLSVVVIVGAAIGLVATMIFLKKYRRPLPAIPPLFSFICIALGIAFPFVDSSKIIISILLILLGCFIMYFIMYPTIKASKKK
jgi:presenilin-like A22 family membrane protease